MKKLIKFCLTLVLSVGLVAGCGLVVLRLIFPPEKIKKITLDYAQNTLHREVRFESVSFNFIGITLNNFSLSEESSFEQGTFLQAKQLQAKVAFWPLLRKRIEIDTLSLDELDVNVIQLPDGSFNFDNLFTSSKTDDTPNPQQPATPKHPFVLTAKHFFATDCNLHYTNQQTQLSTGVNHLNIRVENFDLNQPFNTQISFTGKIQETGGPLISVPTDIDLTVFLAGLDLSKANIQINQARVAYKKLTLDLQGKIENFNNPTVDLTGSLTGLNHTAFVDFLPDLPAFAFPKINLALQAETDLAQSSAQIQNASLRILDNSLNVKGTYGWGKENPAYHLTGQLRTNLAQIVQMAGNSEFNPQGSIRGTFTATDKNNGKDFSGLFTFQDISALYPPFTLTQTNGTLKIASLEHFSCDRLTGLLNNEKFTSSFTYSTEKNISDLKLDLQLDKLILEQWPSSQKETEEGKAASSSKKEEPETYLNLTSKISIGSVQVPYFRSDGVELQTELKNITDSLSKTDGTVSFSLKPGAITDIEKLMKQNKIVRIILLPLNLLNAVGKKLNLDLLDEKTPSKKGEIALTKGEGHYTFTNGLMTLDTTSFESELTNLNATGSINFATDALNMRASATLVTKQTPVVFKITGSLDNPSGKLDVAHTVGSVLGGILNYKAAKKEAQTTEESATQDETKTDTEPEESTAESMKETAEAAKAAAKALGSLFKKKKDSSAAQ